MVRYATYKLNGCKRIRRDIRPILRYALRLHLAHTAEELSPLAHCLRLFPRVVASHAGRRAEQDRGQAAHRLAGQMAWSLKVLWTDGGYLGELVQLVKSLRSSGKLRRKSCGAPAASAKSPIHGTKVCL